jgi:hypothetical protein
MELRTLARMTLDLTYAYLILSAGMSRALHSFCPCGTGEDMDVLA